jgi:DNA-binding transcriptional LysR family regulator
MQSASVAEAQNLLKYLRVEGAGAVVRLISLARTASLRATSVETGLSFNRLKSDLEQLEGRLGVKLFRRTAKGLAITEAGRKAVEIAGVVDEKLIALARLALNTRENPEDLVITVSEGLGAFWLMPQLADRLSDPLLPSIKLRLGTAVPDIARLEADISIQFVEPGSPDIICFRVATLHLIAGLPQSQWRACKRRRTGEPCLCRPE